MFNRFLGMVYPLLFSTLSALAQITIKYPQEYIVIQRDNQNKGVIYITGTLSQPADRVEARLMGIDGESTVTYDTWKVIDDQLERGSFLGYLEALGGRYNLQVRALKENQVVGSMSVVEKVGVGEVFLIVGHSNAAGGPNTGPPATTGRVISMDVNPDPEAFSNYLQTADPSYLPKDYSPLVEGHGISPFAGLPWLWGKFGDLVVSTLQVPVLLYSAAFGGSNIEQTEKSSRGELFPHGFIKSELRMPYINIENALFHLVPQTGLRAVLSAHGVNDGGSTEDQFFERHRAVINFSRKEEGLEDLTWMVAKACYISGVQEHIARAQVRLWELDNVFEGADLNSIGQIGRRDGLHFNEVGLDLAAEKWRDKVVASHFLENSRPIMPLSPVQPEGALPVKWISFHAQETTEGKLALRWSTSNEVNHDRFEVQYSNDGVEFMTDGSVNGTGDTQEVSFYHYALERDFVGSPIYLRLKQVDRDGALTYSNILSVKLSKRLTDGFSPNPSDGLFRIGFDGREVPAQIKVYDMAGILKLAVTNTGELDLSSLNAAMYIAEVIRTDGSKQIKRLVKK
jgi:hypothetical protein